jgi:hypothetical protein
VKPVHVRLPALGTAEKEVLLKLTTAGDPGTWSRDDGSALYESRALTELLCQRLAVRGYLEETHDGACTRYSVSSAGVSKAEQLRDRLSGFTVTTGR